MKVRNKSWRRAQSKRAEVKAFNKFYEKGSYSWGRSVTEEREECLYASKRLKDNMKNCSCWMCGNPRKHWKEITMQEKKANDIFKSQDFD